MQNEGAKRVVIFIDGGNFYHLVLKKIGITELDFNFDKFADFIADGRVIADMGKRYYIGTVSERVGDLRSKVAMSKQTTLFTILKKGGWEVKTSKLRKRVEEIIIDDRVKDHEKILKTGIHRISYERIREKGIDVKIATDLIVGAIDDKYDIAVVISSDADLVPAIDWVRNRTNKIVEYVGFSIIDGVSEEKSTKPTLTLIVKTDIPRTLVVSDLTQFITRSLI